MAFAAAVLQGNNNDLPCIYMSGAWVCVGAIPYDHGLPGEGHGGHSNEAAEAANEAIQTPTETPAPVEDPTESYAPPVTPTPTVPPAAPATPAPVAPKPVVKIPTNVGNPLPKAPGKRPKNPNVPVVPNRVVPKPRPVLQYTENGCGVWIIADGALMGVGCPPFADQIPFGNKFVNHGGPKFVTRYAF